MSVRKGSLSAQVLREAQPLVGAVRDEISDLVSRIKRADAKAYAPQVMPVANQPMSQPRTVSSAQDAEWADDWQLPKEVLDYFVIERA